MKDRSTFQRVSFDYTDKSIEIHGLRDALAILESRWNQRRENYAANALDLDVLSQHLAHDAQGTHQKSICQGQP